MNRSDLQAVAKRVVWFNTPEETLRDVGPFLAHVMTYGTLSDISTRLRHFSEDDFEAAQNAPPPEFLIVVPGPTGTCDIIASQCRTYPSGIFLFDLDVIAKTSCRKRRYLLVFSPAKSKPPLRAYKPPTNIKWANPAGLRTGFPCALFSTKLDRSPSLESEGIAHPSRRGDRFFS